MVILHVGVALTSILYTAYIFFAPSYSKMRVTYGLVAATVITGTILAVSNPAHMPEACALGVAYLVGMFTSIALLRSKLTRIAVAQ
jgi:hypothetical protein